MILIIDIFLEFLIIALMLQVGLFQASMPQLGLQ